MFRRWARLVGREDLLADPRCADDLSRANNHQLINDAMNHWCGERTRDEAIAALEAARIPCGPVYDLDEAASDEQVQARRLYATVAAPRGGTMLPIAKPAVQLSETPGSVRHRPPALGEHTDAILDELGFSHEEIARFRDEKVI
jgi:crotonobetainyl-CoA:carnitine CoA-transferase CaiB-like acyl-CoA transferase